MRPSALVERYRMALEVIANGPEWEPGTAVAKIALTDPWQPQIFLPERLSVREAVGQAREQEPASVGDRARELYDGLAVETLRPEIEALEAEAPVDDDEPEPISLAEIDEELDAELDEAAEEIAEPEKRTVEKRGQDGLLPTEREILAWIREKGEVSPEHVRLKFDLPVHRQKAYVKTLIERGLVVGEGERAGRVYRPVIDRTEQREKIEAGKAQAKAAERERIDAVKARVSQDKPTMPDAKPAPLMVEGAGKVDGYSTLGLNAEVEAVKRNGVGSDEGRVLEAVKYRPKWSITQHAQRLDLHQDKVAAAMRKLEEEGEVKSEPRGGRVVWTLR